MSPITLPRVNLQREARAFSGEAWRLVKAQDPTKKLTDKLSARMVLRQIIEGLKKFFGIRRRFGYPSLHPLLCAPFCSGNYPRNTRFRRAGVTLGVWYGSEAAKTAAIERAFYRSPFYAGSWEDTKFPGHAGKYTVFLVKLEAKKALDLTEGVIARHRRLWEDPTDYRHCQKLAMEFRKIKGEIIRYASVRDKNGGMNIAALSCCAFAVGAPLDYQTWSIWHKRSGVRIACEDDGTGLEFSRDSSGVDWDNPKPI